MLQLGFWSRWNCFWSVGARKVNNLYFKRKIFWEKRVFSNFSCMLLNLNIFFQFEFNCYNFNIWETSRNKLKRHFWAFTVWINCSSDLKKISQSLEQFFLTVGRIILVTKYHFVWPVCAIIKVGYSCNKIITTWIQISHQNWNYFFSNTSHQNSNNF